MTTSGGRSAQAITDAAGPGHRIPALRSGAVAGAVAALVFTALHDVIISDIWFNVVPMVFAGALCGLCLVWSYGAAVAMPSPRSWLVYNGACIGLLLLVGVASLVLLDPIVSMAEIMASSDPLGEVIPPALPLMGAASVLGGATMWLAYGRRVAALPAMLVTQTLLVLLVGHNLAILGLVEIPADGWYMVAEFLGLTVFLGAAFALGLLAIERRRR